MAKLTDITGIGPALAGRLTDAGITTVDAVAKATPAALAEVQGLSAASARLVIADARKVARAAGAAAPAKKAPAKKAPAKKKAPAAKKAPAKKKAASTAPKAEPAAEKSSPAAPRKRWPKRRDPLPGNSSKTYWENRQPRGGSTCPSACRLLHRAGPQRNLLR